MIRLMIVDDDAIIRKGLSKNIPWEKHGFQLVGSAGDGEEGYQLFKETAPEIVISDIKMPFMDGLELAKKVLTDQPETKFILLTGYEEFDYAKQALEIKVFDYLLKPVDLDALMETSRRAARLLKVEQEAQCRLRESKIILKQRFLMHLIKGKYHSAKEAWNEAASLEINFTEGHFMVLTIKIDDYHDPKVFANIARKEAAKSNILNICQDCLTPRFGEILALEGDEIAVVYSSSLKPGEATQDALDLGERIKQVVNGRLLLSVTIGVGKLHDGLLGVASSYDGAKAATEFRHIIGKNQVLFVGDTGMPEDGKLPEFSEAYENLNLKTRMGLTIEAIDVIKNIENKILSRQFISLFSVRFIGMHLAIMVLQEAEVWGNGRPTEQSNPYFELCEQIQEGQTVEEIFEKLCQLITRLTSEINNRRESFQATLIGTAIQYIEGNYDKEGFSLSEVAQAVHVSPVYLSILFKRERNINFSDFLNETRMKKAMELLRNNDLKSYEVADRVGFSNPQYFSVCFKKYTGFSPSEFKKH